MAYPIPYMIYPTPFIAHPAIHHATGKNPQAYILACESKYILD